MLELLSKWNYAALGAAILLVSYLVNRFAPAVRRRIRRVLILYAVFILIDGGARVVGHAHVVSFEPWLEHARTAGSLLAAYAYVNLAALLAFDVILPVIRLPVTAITSDVSIGVAYIFATFGVLRSTGVTASSVVTTSAVVSGVLALSLQTTLGNILGGVALQLDGSIHPGDWVQLADGTQGRVVGVRWRHTVVETRNWDTIIVPNANLLAQNIVLLGRRTGKPLQHRMWVYFNVDYRYAPSRVIDVVNEALAAAPIPNVAEDPKAHVICYDFAKDGRDSFGYYAVRYWLTDLAVDDPTSSRIRTRVHAALSRANIPLARPAQTVFFRADEEEGTRAHRHMGRRLEAIAHIELFETLTADERAFVAEALNDAPFTAGETITRQGAVAHWLYVLVSGQVEIRRVADDKTHTKKVATIDAPGFFGEMGLMTGEPRRADVIATSDVKCYRLPKNGLERILRERPEVAQEISRTLAKRETELSRVLEGLDEEAASAHLVNAQSRILGRIQEFFGLERTAQA